ncbi:hypothetical protein EZS27_012967 [termite gut metagenome]|uniref:Uncharacterized protein n=1 Tax=termite gut metagenome TaxID=433724 RepID=A0A5J4S1A4_9ZZZZ
MKRIYINKYIVDLAQEYAKNLFLKRQINFEKPLDNLQKLEDGLRKNKLLDVKYANYINKIIVKYPILNAIIPQEFDAITNNEFNCLTEVELKDKFIINKAGKFVLQKSNTKKGTEIYKFIVNAMRYDAVRDEEFLSYVHKLGIKVCVYCNAQLAITTEDNNGKISGKYELDHFYPKSKYPFLCTSFFNLQPCCSHCNKSKLTRSSDFGLYTMNYSEINPFDFSITKKSLVKYMLSHDSNDLEIIFNCQDATLKTNHENLFHISALYETQKDVVEEIIWKSRIYNKNYRESLIDAFSNKFDKINFNRFILGNYDNPKDVHKRPLAKLIQDIARQLKII